MASSPLASAVLFYLGPVAITRPVVTTWAIMAVLALVSWFVTRRLALHPDRRQAVVELIVTGIMGQI
jgi:F-type H+-transporting ATPase subunit a